MAITAHVTGGGLVYKKYYKIILETIKNAVRVHFANEFTISL
jgi:hypothetical protein